MTSRELSYVRQFDVPMEHPKWSDLFATSSQSHLNRYSDIHANESTLFPSESCPVQPKHTFKDLDTPLPSCGGHSVNSVDSNRRYPYLNANIFLPQHFFECPHTFVACQSPLPKQFGAFWATMLRYEVPTVVMLTRLSERKGSHSYTKAHQYWPDKAHQPYVFDSPVTGTYPGLSIEVTEHSHDERQNITTRKILVKKDNVAHTVTHVHYCGWADYSVPDNDEAFMSLVRMCESADPKMGPIFVHCSAGIGRTGTLMGAYFGRWMMRSGGGPLAGKPAAEVRRAVIELVGLMKRTRNGTVQKQEQLVYLLKCLGLE